MENSDGFLTTRMNKPIYGITLFFILGIIIGRYLTLPFLPLYLSLTVLFVLTFLLYLKKKQRWASYSLFLITLLIGIVYFHYVYYPHSSNHIVVYAPSEEKVTIVGEVINRPQLKERKIRFTIEVKKIIENGQEKSTQGRVWVVSYFPLENYDYGDTVRLEGKLRLPEGAREKGAFDWQRYLSYQGIWVELSTGNVTVEKEGGSSLMKWAYKSRDWMVRVIEHTLPELHSSVLKGIMLGDKESLPPQVQENFLRTGTGHILVVSGLHVGLILLLLLILFRVLALPSRLAFLIVIPILGYYVLITGLRPPVIRATLMVIIGLVSLTIGRDTPLLAILSLACLIILLLNPLSLFDASFKLSFLAVAGIVYFTPFLEIRLKRLPRWLKRPLAISLSAQLFILPLLAFYFNRLPLIGVITNLIVAPLITIVLALGFLSVALGMVSLALAQWVAYSNWLTIGLLLEITDFFSFSKSLTLSNLACPSFDSFPFWILLVYYPVLISLPHLFRKFNPEKQPL
ncbi:MAG TPA: ComEC family competence protein [bacterium]|nr:ComEC family competence protein [bacterium]